MPRTLIAFAGTVGAIALLLTACGRIGVEVVDKHGMTALMRAARDGDLGEAQRLIAWGADVNQQVPTRHLRELMAFLSFMQQLPESDIGYTPLLYAVSEKRHDLARLLIAKGANVHHDASGTTAFGLAVTRSDLEMLRLLADAGARGDARQFVMAVRSSTPATVQYLLEQGADPNAVPPPRRERDHLAVPPIILAAQRGDTTVVSLLVGAGAALTARDGNGWTAARWARRKAERKPQPPERARMVEMLERSGGRDASGERASELFEAVLAKDAVRVRHALRARANPNARDERGVPPLVYAASGAAEDVVAALIEAGANVNASPAVATTPLNAAVTGGSLEVVRMLVKAGANVNQADRMRQTPLQLAGTWKRTEIAKLLLASSAKADPAALAHAALSGDAEQVRMLLAQGADPNAGKGHALIEAARGCLRQDNSAVIRLLIAAGADPRLDPEHTALHRASALCDPNIVRLLLARGGDPNAQDAGGYTALTAAASSGKLENVKVLIAAKADVNVRDASGHTALYWASRYPEVQQELRRAGAR